MERIAQVGDTDPLYAGEVITRAAIGNIAAFFQTIADKRREQRYRGPVTVTDITNIAAFNHQGDVVADLGADLFQQTFITQRGITFIFMQADFHHFQQVKHRDVMQTIGSARNR